MYVIPSVAKFQINLPFFDYTAAFSDMRKDHTDCSGSVFYLSEDFFATYKLELVLFEHLIRLPRPSYEVQQTEK